LTDYKAINEEAAEDSTSAKAIDSAERAFSDQANE